MMKIIKDDEGSKIWRKNKMIGFVDEKDVLYGIHPKTGFSHAVAPIGHDGEIRTLLEAWLKLQE